MECVMTDGTHGPAVEGQDMCVECLHQSFRQGVYDHLARLDAGEIREILTTIIADVALFVEVLLNDEQSAVDIVNEMARDAVTKVIS